MSDVEIRSCDIPGFSVASNNGVTVALDISLTKTLKEEGLAREFVNRIQGVRKENGLGVTDKIKIIVKKNPSITNAIKNNFSYICEETLAVQLNYEEESVKDYTLIELIDGVSVNVFLVKK